MADEKWDKRDKLRMLTPLKPGVNKYDIMGFDTEDNGEGAPGNFILACFYCKMVDKPEPTKHVFWSRDEARRFLFTKRNRNTIIFAHNLAYDLANLDYPEGTCEIIPKKCGIVGAVIRHGTHQNVRLMDTGNFFIGATAAQLGKQLGYDKVDMDIRFLRGARQADIPADKKLELEDYCMRDAEITCRTGAKIIELASGFSTKFKCFTMASLALRLWRTNFLHQKITCRPMTINDNERLAYYGGRTEVFDYAQHKDVWYEDINSSYPFAMKHQAYPNPATCHVYKRPQWKDVQEYEGVSLVRVRVEKEFAPPLPYRMITGSRKLLFPYGEWTAAYTHPELKMAEAHGVKIMEVKESIIYHDTFNPFKEFVDVFHERKKTSTGIEREFNKGIMNSLSGKFGEKRDEVLRCREEMLTPEQLVKYLVKPDMNGWVSMIGGREPDSTHSFPVLIAYITAYGRIKLYEERLTATDPLYCDTDSCVMEETPGTNIGLELGQWKQEEHENFVAHAPKFYEMDGHMKLKGVKRNSQRLVVDGQEFFEFDRPIKMAEGIHRKKAPNTWITVRKQVSYNDDKRVKTLNGSSDPLRVRDDPLMWRGMGELAAATFS